MLLFDRNLRRLYVCKRRVHHGAVGVVAVVLGLMLAAHDRADFPWSLSKFEAE